MKKKSLFKNKKQMIIYTLLYILCIGLFIYIGQIDFQKDRDTEAKQFSDLYKMVNDDNLFHFSDVTDVHDILNGRSGVILMGFPMNEWMDYYAYILIRDKVNSV